MNDQIYEVFKLALTEDNIWKEIIEGEDEKEEDAKAFLYGKALLEKEKEAREKRED